MQWCVFHFNYTLLICRYDFYGRFLLLFCAIIVVNFICNFLSLTHSRSVDGHRTNWIIYTRLFILFIHLYNSTRQVYNWSITCLMVCWPGTLFCFIWNQQSHWFYQYSTAFGHLFFIRFSHEFFGIPPISHWAQ